MNKSLAIFICWAFFLLPLMANAYVGPGAGLSLLGALWALIIAVGTALIFILAWPIRRMRRRKREAEEIEAQEREAKEQEAEERRENTPVADSATTRPQASVVQQDDFKQSRRQ